MKRSLKVLLGLAILLSVGVNPALAEKLMMDTSQIVVVSGVKGGQIEYNAASEFVKYLRKMTGSKIDLIKDNEFIPEITEKRGVVLIGNSATNQIVYNFRLFNNTSFKL